MNRAEVEIELARWWRVGECLERGDNPVSQRCGLCFQCGLVEELLGIAVLEQSPIPILHVLESAAHMFREPAVVAGNLGRVRPVRLEHRPSREAVGVAAGAVFETNRANPTKIAGFDGWLAEFEGGGFPSTCRIGIGDCSRAIPSSSSTRPALEAQAAALGNWIVATFQALADSPPPR